LEAAAAARFFGGMVGEVEERKGLSSARKRSSGVLDDDGGSLRPVCPF
jgi:hypothetical protein